MIAEIRFMEGKYEES